MTDEPIRKGFDLFETWKQAESVAMHFNDLLIRLRFQALAGVATVTTIVGVVLKINEVPPEVRWGTLAATFTSLAFLWLALWILDFTYYNRLLLGAVENLLKIERVSRKRDRLDSLTLSTDIERSVRRSKPASMWSWSYWRRAKGRWLFYSIVFFVLLLGALESWNELKAVRAAPPVAPAAQTSPTTRPSPAPSRPPEPTLPQVAPANPPPSSPSGAVREEIE